jgi:hypothetical protein
VRSIRTSTWDAPASFAVLIAASLTAARGRARKSESTFLFTPQPYFKSEFWDSPDQSNVRVIFFVI